MYLWVDDMRTPPSDHWIWVKSVKEAKAAINCYERNMTAECVYINSDHDAGGSIDDGGD